MKSRMMKDGLARRVSKKRIGLIAWPGALGLIVLMSLEPGIARAEDSQGSLWDFDKKFINELLYSFGLVKKPHLDQQIEYRERPPLVVPPTRAVPPPQTAAAQDPNWPVDPDINRRGEAERRKANRQDFDPDQFTNPLRPSELRASGGGAASGAQNRSAGDADTTDPLRPSQLGSSGWPFGSLFGGTSGRQEQQAGTQAGTIAPERSRRSLTEPPAGYQVPSPNQPYGISPQADYRKPAKPADHALGDDQGL